MADPVVTLAGFQLHPPNADGTGCDLEDDASTPGLDGWYGTPKLRSAYTARPADAGSYWSPLAYPDVRVISCNGVLIGATSTAFLQTLRTLRALCPDPATLYPLVVTDDAGTLTAMVQRTDAVLVKPVNNLACQFSIGLTAPDPYLYDQTVNSASTLLAAAQSGLDWSTGGGLDWSTGGGLNWGPSTSDGTCSIPNAGTAPSYPTITIAGPTDSGTLSGISITNTATGQILAFSGTLQLNDILVINTNPASRSVLLNGNDVWPYLSTSQWFPVPAGGTLRCQFQGTSTSTTPQMTISAPNAYL